MYADGVVLRRGRSEAAETLPEPFSRVALINWVSARRPDVGIASIAAHIQFATDNAGHTAATPFAGRTPLLHRVDRGRYRPLPLAAAAAAAAALGAHRAAGGRVRRPRRRGTRGS